MEENKLALFEEKNKKACKIIYFMVFYYRMRG